MLNNNKEHPFITAAIHSGHQLRPEVRTLTTLSDKQRLREEDPFTDAMAKISMNRLVVNRSRFEVDLNRVRNKAVYLVPDDAWGLQLWKEEPDEKIKRNSMKLYDQFYANLHDYIEKVNNENGYSLIYELHSFNHKRKKYFDVELPDIIIGTGKINRERWLPVIIKLKETCAKFDFFGRKLRVAENYIFPGGNFSATVAKWFPQKCCTLAIEFRKFFMDEFNGELYPNKFKLIIELLKETIPSVLKEVKEIVNKS